MLIRHFTAALILFIPSLVLADSFGRVELSLSQWQETMDRLAKAEALKNPLPLAEAAPPCSAIVSTVNCEIAAQKESVRLTTDFEIEVLRNEWTILPLADASIPLISSQVSEGRIIVREGAYALLTNQTGKIKVRLVLEKSATDSLDFWLAPANSTQARLTKSEADQHFTLNEKLLTSEAIGLVSNETGKTAFQLRLTAAPTQEIIDPSPGIWESRSETQIAYEDGRLNYHNRVVLLCTSGNDDAALLHLPSNSIVLQAEGDGLEKWAVSTEAEKNTLSLHWKKAGSRQRIILLHLALSFPNIVGAWPLISPQAPNQKIPSEIWQLTSLPGLRQNLPLEQPLLASLSGWMRERLLENEANAFQAPSGSNIEVTALKTVALAQARIESAKFSTELAIGGGMLTEAHFEVVSSEKATVDWQFAKDVRIISCLVAGQRQAPVDLGEGRIQLNIPATRERVAVELTFSQQLETFDPASGQVKLTMPLTSLLTKSANWSIKLPPGLSLSAFDGSVTADTTGSNGELRFHQELYRETAPLAVLFYQKKMK